MKRFQHIQWLILLLSMSSCITEIALDDQSGAGVLVIDGQISNELKRHQVIISRSRAFGEEGEQQMVSGLEVYLESEQISWPLQEIEEGVYETDSIAGIPGQSYRLRIIEGSQEFTAMDQMPLLPESFTPATFARQEEFWEYEFRRHQFGFAKANFWELRLIRDSLPPELQNINPDRLGLQVGVEVDEDLTYVFSYYTHPTIEVSGLLNFEIPHFYGFQSGFRLEQRRYKLSDEYYEYLLALFRETEWRGTLFPSTPAQVEGNISGGALGYFRAVSMREIAFEPE